MQLPGDVDGCREAARGLRGAARALDGTRDRIERLSRDEWRGVAAIAWTGVRDSRVEAVRAQAAGLAAATAVVDRFADTLEDLQHRAARLSAEAADSGLLLDDCGWIPPVPDLAHELDPGLLREVTRRRQVRRRVVAAAAVVLAELRAAHDRLACELDGQTYGPAQTARASDGGMDAGWLKPNAWDAPSLTLTAGSVAAEVRPALPSILRSARGMGAAGAGVGVTLDLVQGRDVDDAATKAGVVLGATAVATVLAPVAAPAVLVVVASGAVGYGAGKAFDKWGHHLPWVQHPPERDKPRRRYSSTGAPRAVPQLPTVQQHAQPRHVVHRTPQPAPGPAVRR